MKRIAFLTDIHLDEQYPIDQNINPRKNLTTVLADLSRQKITEVIFGGDIGVATAHPYFFNALKQFSVNILLGNHDKFEDVKKHFNKSTDKNALYYKIEDAGYTYLFLDSATDEISNRQLQWLQMELKTEKQIILFIHHPILSIATKADELYPLKNRNVLQSVLLNYKKKITIFCGHYHMNDEQEHYNIKQITTLSLSFQLVKNEQEIKVDNTNFGYRIIEIHEDKIETQLYSFENTIL
jgi:3',5'-cyclic AMP phosphodiesterase CpdA